MKMKEFGGGGRVLGSGTEENVCFIEIVQTKLFRKNNLNDSLCLKMQTFEH